MGLRMHDGQVAHIDHAQFARRAILPQAGLLQFLVFRSTLLVIPPRHKGRTRRHERGGNAVDAKVLETCSIKADGEVVWLWHFPIKTMSYIV
jgi:hypothetical protein